MPPRVTPSPSTPSRADFSGSHSNGSGSSEEAYPGNALVAKIANVSEVIRNLDTERRQMAIEARRSYGVSLRRIARAWDSGKAEYESMTSPTTIDRMTSAEDAAVS